MTLLFTEPSPWRGGSSSGCEGRCQWLPHSARAVTLHTQRALQTALLAANAISLGTWGKGITHKMSVKAGAALQVRPKSYKVNVASKD